MTAAIVYGLLVIAGFLIPIPILVRLDRPRRAQAPPAAAER